MRYYLAPTTWRTDEWRDIVTEDNIQQQFETWRDDATAGDWQTVDDARNECDVLDGNTLRDACLAAHEMDGDNVNPEAATGYGVFEPLWNN